MTDGPWGLFRNARTASARGTLTVVVAAAVLLFGASCCPNPADIFPTSVGSVWNMDMVLIAGSAFQGYDTVQTGTMVTTAIEKTYLSTGQEVVKFTSDISIHVFDPDSVYAARTESYYREDDGWVFSYATTDDSVGDTVMMSDPKVGATWSQGTDGSVTVIGQEDVTVGAGTYKKAWKVRTTTTVNGLAADTYEWYARGAGLVKIHSEYSLGVYSEVFDQELVSASIK